MKRTEMIKNRLASRNNKEATVKRRRKIMNKDNRIFTKSKDNLMKLKVRQGRLTAT